MLPDTNAMGIEEIILHMFKEEGRQEGRQEVMELAEKKEITAIRNMLHEGLDVSFICRVLGVPEELVLSIKSDERNSN